MGNAPNINHLWAQLIVEELVRNRVHLFVLSPGSRSTPLAAAVAQHPSARSIVHFDERAAAYCALGCAKGARAPAALVCTSGTATANYYPGICRDCGDACEPEYKRCWRCQREADWQEYQDVKHAASNGTL